MAAGEEGQGWRGEAGTEISYLLRTGALEKDQIQSIGEFVSRALELWIASERKKEEIVMARWSDPADPHGNRWGVHWGKGWILPGNLPFPVMAPRQIPDLSA